VQNLLFGLITGSILALATLGFAMVRQTEGFLNIAHSQYLAIGAFVGVVLVDDYAVNVFIAAVITFGVLGVAGVVLARLLFDPVRKSGALILLFTSVGLAYALYGVVIALFGTEARSYPIDFGPSLDLGFAMITVAELLIICLALTIVAGLWLFLNQTNVGNWVRAVASNPELARLRGVPVQVVSSTVWFISAGLAGLAGFLLGAMGNVNSEMGWANVPLILVVAVLGGVDRIYGVIAAAMLLGITMDVGSLVVPSQYIPVLVFGVLAIVLVIRPRGLFSSSRRMEYGF
jgi:neutral amino acid transport system permease protein